MITFTFQSFFQFEEIYWLDTALVLLELISGVDYKLSLIQEILIKTSKPWSDKVKEIGFLVFNYPTVHPLQQKIKKLLKNEQFLILLEKYDINENNFVTWDDVSNLSTLIHICSVIFNYRADIP